MASTSTPNEGKDEEAKGPPTEEQPIITAAEAQLLNEKWNAL